MLDLARLSAAAAPLATMAVLLVTALLHIHTISVRLTPPSGIMAMRTTIVVAWLYLPQSVAAACLVAHAGVAGREWRTRA